MNDTSIYLERDGDIATIVLNRPDQLNAMTQDMWQGLSTFARDIEADPDIKVAIIRGVNEKAFAAGADIKELRRVNQDAALGAGYSKAVADGQADLYQMTKPLIAFIEGPCIGGGCGVALCADFRLSAPSGRFGITPAKLGIAYSLEDTKRLVDVVGPVEAKRILFTGRIISSQDAHRIGLVDQLVNEANGYEEAFSFAREIATGSQVSVRAAKKFTRMILAGHSNDTEETVAIIRKSFGDIDFLEGTAAFVEKRKPKFPFR